VGKRHRVLHDDLDAAGIEHGPAGQGESRCTVSGTAVATQREAGPCTFTATDGRRCILNQWHKAPRNRRGRYVTYGDIGDAHLLEGEHSCKWRDGPETVPGEVAQL
jgi:hypothetical protein